MVWAYFETADPGASEIEPYDPNAPDRLVPLITAFHLGLALRYKPLCDHVLKGLRALRATADDPIAALGKVYCGQSPWKESASSNLIKAPDPRLREWVVKWLAVSDLSAERSRYAAKYKTNLGVVSQHPQWSDRFAGLVARSAELAQDVYAVELALNWRHGTNAITDASPNSPAQQYSAPQRAPYFRDMQQAYEFFGPLMSSQGTSLARNSDSSLDHPNRNPKPFDLAGLWDNLPADNSEDNHDRSRTLPGSTLRPEHLQAFMCVQQWEQALRDTPGLRRARSPDDVALLNTLLSRGQSNFADRITND